MGDFRISDFDEYYRRWIRGRSIPANKDSFSPGEMKQIATLLDWKVWAIFSEDKGEEVSRATMLGRGRPEKRVRDWLMKNQDEIDTIVLRYKLEDVVEIYKQVDDWYWVVFYKLERRGRGHYDGGGLEFGRPERGLWRLIYRCDQMDGLLSLLRWAMPRYISDQS